MEDTEEIPIDEILKSIRQAITEREQMEYFRSFMPHKDLSAEDDVELLSKSSLVNREDIPYQSGFWNFNDVAKKIMKKYNLYFHRRHMAEYASIDRVPVKEDI